MAGDTKAAMMLSLALALLAGSLAGCAAFSASAPAAKPTGGAAQAAAKDAPPKVEDCTLITQSSPQMYSCKVNGKYQQFTAHQLQQLGEQEEAAGK